MTHTSKTIQDLQEFEIQIREEMASRRKLEFQVGDLEVKENSLFFESRKLDKKSTVKVLSQLKVRPDFLSLQKQMREEDWEDVAEKLKSVYATQTVFARTKKEEGAFVTDLQVAHKKAPNGGIQIPEVFGLLYESLLETSAEDFVLREAYLAPHEDTVVISLVREDETLDPFNDKKDLWKTGKQIRWSSTHFNISPFVERLVCSNGAVAKQFGFDSNISKQKYNFAKIYAILEREIKNASDSITPILINATNHLKRNNVSLREYLQYRKMFEVSAEEESNPYEKILDKYFDLEKITKAYKVDILEKPNLWKQTADTGKNAYDFFNDLTYIASHPTEFNLEIDKKMDLQVSASNLLFKEQLDLELVAPKVSLI